MKCIVVDIHAALGKVGCVEVALAMNEGAGPPRVARAILGPGNSHGMGRRRRCAGCETYASIPADDRSINGREQKSSRSVGRQEKISSAAVENRARGRTRGCLRVGWIRRRNGDNQSLLRAGAVV